MSTLRATAEMPEHQEAAVSKKHLRGSSMLLCGRLLSLGINLAINILLVRWLAKGDFGAFSYALAIGSLGAAVVACGLDKAVARFVPIYHERADFARMLGTIVLALITILGLGFTLTILVWTAHGVILGSLVSDPMAASLLAILIVLAPLEALDHLLAKLLAAFSKPRAIFLRKHVVGPALRLCVVALVVPLHGGMHVLAMGYVAAWLLGILLYVHMLIAVFREKDLWPGPGAAFKFPARELFGYSVPLLTSDLAFVLRGSLAVILLEFFHSTSSVAEFRAVLPVARLNHIVFESFILLFLPMASRLFARGQFAAISGMYWRTATWIAVLTFPVFAITFALAQPVTVFLFGSQYAESAMILAILAVGQYANAALGFNSVTLKVFGKVKWIVAVDLLAAATSVGLGLWLIPLFGAVGAAWSVSLTHIVHNLLAQITLLRLRDIETLPAHYLRAYASIVPAAVWLFTLQWLFQPPLLVGLVGAAAGSLAVVFFNRDVLNVGQVFPEIKRLPLVGRLCNAPVS